MKTSILPLFFLFYALTCSGQNLIVNGNFETGMLTPWGGFNNQVLTDDLTSSLVGNANNAEASLFQEFDVTPGSTYKVSFQHRWVSGTTNYNCVVRVKNTANLSPNLPVIGGTVSDGFALNTTPDKWFDGSFSFMVPDTVRRIRLLFYKANNNRPLRIDNVSVTLETPSALTELQPFNFTAGPNPTNDFIYLSADQPIERIALFSASGVLVRNQTINSSNARVEVSSLAKGLYIVKAHIADRIGTYKLMVH